MKVRTEEWETGQRKLDKEQESLAVTEEKGRKENTIIIMHVCACVSTQTWLSVHVQQQQENERIHLVLKVLLHRHWSSASPIILFQWRWQHVGTYRKSCIGCFIVSMFQWRHRWRHRAVPSLKLATVASVELISVFLSVDKVIFFVAASRGKKFIRNCCMQSSSCYRHWIGIIIKILKTENNFLN